MIRISVLMIAGALGCALLMSGCSSSGGGAPYQDRDRVPPVVSGFAITPPANGWHAGDCSVRIHATDNIGVSEVMARVTASGYTGDPIALTLQAGSELYVGACPAPPNTASDGRAKTYYVSAWAKDEDGNIATVEQSLSFSVPAPDAPPPPPVDW